MQLKVVEESRGWTKTIWKNQKLSVRELNDRLMMAEHAFIDKDALFGMTRYKHLVRSVFQDHIAFTLLAFSIKKDM